MPTHLPVYITNAFVNDLIERSLREDVGSGDITSVATIGQDVRAQARMEAREAGIIAGTWLAKQVFETVDPYLTMESLITDGEPCEAGDAIASVEGPARSILTAERLALNIIQRMSGIATMTRKMVDIAKPHGVEILDTRKTAPGLRLMDKWAVELGGGRNHRIGLFDMILIKDNHIAAAGGIRQAVEAARAYCDADGRHLTIEVEVRTLDEVDEVIGVEGVDIVLLDNMTRWNGGDFDVSMLQEAVSRINGRMKTEASGNVRLNTVEAIAMTGVDYISCGALTHSVTALDVGLNITVEG
jgi:nicotinate-nucleotide pyrophosphorylase (carboxylating)